MCDIGDFAGGRLSLFGGSPIFLLVMFLSYRVFTYLRCGCKMKI